jgi:hypothetical protein
MISARPGRDTQRIRPGSHVHSNACNTVELMHVSVHPYGEQDLCEHDWTSWFFDTGIVCRTVFWVIPPELMPSLRQTRRKPYQHIAHCIKESDDTMLAFSCPGREMSQRCQASPMAINRHACEQTHRHADLFCHSSRYCFICNCSEEIHIFR